MSKKLGFQPDGQSVSEKPRFFYFFGSTFFSSPTPCFFLAKKFRFNHVGCSQEQKVGVSAWRPRRQGKTSFFQFLRPKCFFLQPHPVFFSPKSFVFITWGVFMSKKWGFQPNGHAVSEKPRFFSFLGQNFFSSSTPCFLLAKKFRFYHVGCFHEQNSGGFSQTAKPSAKNLVFSVFWANIFFSSATPCFFLAKKIHFYHLGLFS